LALLMALFLWVRFYGLGFMFKKSSCVHLSAIIILRYVLLRRPHPSVCC